MLRFGIAARMFFLAAAAGVSAAETLVVGSGLVLTVRLRACLFHRPGTKPVYPYPEG